MSGLRRCVVGRLIWVVNEIRVPCRVLFGRSASFSLALSLLFAGYCCFRLVLWLSGLGAWGGRLMTHIVVAMTSVTNSHSHELNISIFLIDKSIMIIGPVGQDHSRWVGIFGV